MQTVPLRTESLPIPTQFDVTVNGELMSLSTSPVGSWCDLLCVSMARGRGPRCSETASGYAHRGQG